MFNYGLDEYLFVGARDIFLLTALLGVVTALYYVDFFINCDISRRNKREKLLVEEDEEVSEEEEDDNVDENADEKDDDTADELTDPGSDYSTSHLSCDDSEEEEIRIHRQITMKKTQPIKEGQFGLNNNDFSDEESEIYGSSDGLVAKLKTRRLKELEAKLSQDQLEEERRIEREQLSAIFELLKKQEAELNMKEIDENELNAQLNLYR